MVSVSDHIMRIVNMVLDILSPGRRINLDKGRSQSGDEAAKPRKSCPKQSVARLSA